MERRKGKGEEIRNLEELNHHSNGLSASAKLLVLYAVKDVKGKTLLRTCILVVHPAELHTRKWYW